VWRAMISARSRPRSTDLSWPAADAPPRAASSLRSCATVIRIRSTFSSTIAVAQKSPGARVHALSAVQLAPSHGAWVHVV
jgi:hypothetical protein